MTYDPYRRLTAMIIEQICLAASGANQLDGIGPQDHHTYKALLFFCRK